MQVEIIDPGEEAARIVDESLGLARELGSAESEGIAAAMRAALGT